MRQSSIILGYYNYRLVAVAGCVLFVVGVVAEILNLAFDRGLLAWLIGACAVAVIALGAAIAFSSAVVLARTRRLEHRHPDLYLDLNKSRTAERLAKPDGFRGGFIRHCLARFVIGHDFLVGDAVKVRSFDEIAATLDVSGCINGIPFMPEMRRFCGSTARVLRSVDKIYDYDRTRDMRDLKRCVILTGMHCDGAMHGQCEAACFTLWNVAWLEHAPDVAAPREQAPGAPKNDRAPAANVGERFSCQYTQLHAATRPLRPLDPVQDLRPLIAGNVTVPAFVVAIATRAFNFLQRVRGGVTFPVMEARKNSQPAVEERALSVGDLVIVRPPGEIAQTLNRQGKHKGLWFDRDMVKFCGQKFRVSATVTRLIDVTNGQMRSVKTPCYLLENVDSTGEYLRFNAQSDPLFWRDVWLQRVEEVSARQ